MKKDYLSLLAGSAKKRKRRNKLIDLAEKSEIDAVSEIIDNILRGNLSLSKRQIANLKKISKTFKTCS